MVFVEHSYAFYTCTLAAMLIGKHYNYSTMTTGVVVVLFNKDADVEALALECKVVYAMANSETLSKVQRYIYDVSTGECDEEN